jgi:hypothetical protein
MVTMLTVLCTTGKFVEKLEVGTGQVSDDPLFPLLPAALHQFPEHAEGLRA